MPDEHPVISQTRGSREGVSIHYVVTSKDEKRIRHEPSQMIESEQRGKTANWPRPEGLR
jgi:hypothetical protein